MSLVESVCQPSALRILIWPDASKAQNNIAAVSADGSTVWVLILRLNLCSRSIAFVVRALRHWLGGSRVKVNSRSPASLQAVGNRAVLEPPFVDEGLAARLDFWRRRRIDHVVIIRGDLVIQALWRVREKVPVLVHLMPTSA